MAPPSTTPVQGQPGTGNNRFQALNHLRDEAAELAERFDGSMGIEGNQPKEVEDVDRDEEGEALPRLAVDEIFMTAEEVSTAIAFNESLYQGEFWNWADPITQSYDSVDGIAAPSLKQKKEGKGKGWSLAGRAFCSVQLTDKANMQRTIGIGLAGKFEGGDSGFVKVGIQFASQLPAITLHITRLNGKKPVDVYFFANSVLRQRDSGNPNIGFAFGGGQKAVQYPKYHREVNWHGDAGNLLQIGIQLNPQTTTPLDFNDGRVSINPTRPIFRGISAKELEDLWNQLPSDPKVGFVMDDGDLLLTLLSKKTNLNIFRYWPQTEEGIEIATKATDFMSTAFRMSAQFGNHWFYQMQQAEGYRLIHQEDFDLTKLQMPRFLGKKWKIKVDKDNMPVGDPEVVQCAAFPDDATQVYPDMKSMAFELRLALERDRQHQSAVLKSSFPHDDFSIRATFVNHPRRPGFYVVELRTHDNSLLAKDPTLRPRIDARVKVEVRDSPNVTAPNDDDGDTAMQGIDIGSLKTFDGLIAEDIWESRAECVLIVEGPELDLSECAERFVKVECVDDMTPANRMKATIHQIANGDESSRLRMKGVDIPNLVLRAPPQIEATGSMFDEIQNSSRTENVEAILANMAKAFRLKEKQVEAFQKAFTTLSGRAIIKGPPGCGKTFLLMVIAEALRQIGIELGKARPVVACAPSNVASDAMLDKWKVMPGTEDSRGIRYRGSYTKDEKASKAEPAPRVPDNDGDFPMAAEGEEGEVDEERLKEIEQEKKDLKLKEALWELAEEARPGREHPNAEYGFYRHRLGCIQRYAQNKAHSLYKQAVEWLDLRQRLKDPKSFTKEDLKLKKAEFHELEDQLTEYYFKNDVDIVFCTNSSSAHGFLRKYYDPRALVSDEAAVTPLADCATPMGVFRDSLELIILGGDDQQQAPVVASKGSNEFSHLLGKSLFTYVWNAGDEANAPTELDIQHRMHPELCEPISNLWYGGRLQAADSVKTRVNKQWVTLDHLLKSGLGVAWNGRRRVGVSVDGDTISSMAYNNTTSWCNIAEARAISSFIKWVIDSDPPQGGEAVDALSFLVLTPYTGQVQIIKTLLAKAGVKQVRVKEVDEMEIEEISKTRVASTRAIQGEQAPFVIVSMVRNIQEEPLNLGIVADSHGLNVAFSRPEEFLLVFGNWNSWSREYYQGSVLLHRHRSKIRRFGQVVGDFIEKGDLISYGDWQRFVNGQAIQAREWDSMFVGEPLTEPEPSRGRGRGRGGRGGIPRGQGHGSTHRGGPRGGVGGNRGGFGPRNDQDRFAALEQRARDEKNKSRPNQQPPRGGGSSGRGRGRGGRGG